MQAIAFIALGGAMGSVARFLAQKTLLRVIGGAFPYGTLAINLVGSFVLGYMLGASLKTAKCDGSLLLFFTSGFCGGFTTFSAFTYETYAMLLDGKTATAFLYLATSCLLGLGATAAGVYVNKFA